MGYRKVTLRRMYAHARKLAKVVNEFEGLLRVLKTQVKVVNDLEFSLAAYKRTVGDWEKAPEGIPEVGALTDEDLDQDMLPGLGGPGDVFLGLDDQNIGEEVQRHLSGA